MSASREIPTEFPTWNDVETSVRQIIDTVQATGGLVRTPDGLHAPVADPDWIDLGECVLNLAQILGIQLDIEETDARDN